MPIIKYELPCILVNSWFQPFQSFLSKPEQQLSGSIPEFQRIISDPKKELMYVKEVKSGLSENETIIGNALFCCLRTKIDRVIDGRCSWDSTLTKPIFSNNSNEGQSKTFSCDGISLVNNLKTKRGCLTPLNALQLLQFSRLSTSSIIQPNKGSFMMETKSVLKKPSKGFQVRMQSNTKESTLKRNRSQCTFVTGCIYPTRHITCNSGCPYQCKNCFRACLVSQNCMQTLLRRKFSNGSNNAGKKIRYISSKY